MKYVFIFRNMQVLQSNHGRTRWEFWNSRRLIVRAWKFFFSYLQPWRSQRMILFVTFRRQHEKYIYLFKVFFSLILIPDILMTFFLGLSMSKGHFYKYFKKSSKFTCHQIRIFNCGSMRIRLRNPDGNTGNNIYLCYAGWYVEHSHHTWRRWLYGNGRCYWNQEGEWK
jgi:hypothetical protein